MRAARKAFKVQVRHMEMQEAMRTGQAPVADEEEREQETEPEDTVEPELVEGASVAMTISSVDIGKCPPKLV